MASWETATVAVESSLYCMFQVLDISNANPSTAAAGVPGLSADAATEIARRAPAGYEASITDFAKDATVNQMRRCLRRYTYDDDTEKTRPRPVEDQRSVAMGTDKMRAVVDTGAEYLVAGDNSCLLHIGGLLTRNEAGVKTIHLAEILASTEQDLVEAGRSSKSEGGAR